MTGGNILLALLLLPSVVTGTFAGVWLNRKFSDRAFALAVYLLALAAGAYLLLG
jgi:uncharacterized membrane protein YfcA